MKINLIFSIKKSEAENNLCLYLFAHSNDFAILENQKFELDIPINTVRELINYIRVKEEVKDFLTSSFGKNYQIVFVIEALSCSWIRLE